MRHLYVKDRVECLDRTNWACLYCNEIRATFVFRSDALTFIQNFHSTHDYSHWEIKEID